MKISCVSHAEHDKEFGVRYSLELPDFEAACCSRWLLQTNGSRVMASEKVHTGCMRNKNAERRILLTAVREVLFVLGGGGRAITDKDGKVTRTAVGDDKLK
jgi:hypothetical protein